ncbi:IclR family transcriptional regulator [Afifella sp. IM 167]|uniref:IclR family transcriptional regulator n=1 Tax=Afifella sp. IM 167 TaxID=2033586 RepID=UPI001CC9F7B8
MTESESPQRNRKEQAKAPTSAPRKPAKSGNKRTTGKEPPSSAKSTLKALQILEAVVAGGRPVSVAELSSGLAYSKPTTHRIATFLEEQGYLEREFGSRRFIASQRLIELALNVLIAAAQRPTRRSILNWVVEQTGETCNIGVMHNGELVYIDRVESHWPLGLRFEPGSRVPLHCTAIGKLVLSQLPEEALTKLLGTLRLARYTDNTVTDQAELRRRLEEISRAGFSIDNQEFMSGVVCVAVPIFDASGRACAGLAISAPEARMSAERAEEHVAVLRAAAAQMQETILASPPGRSPAEEAEELVKTG